MVMFLPLMSFALIYVDFVFILEIFIFLDFRDIFRFLVREIILHNLLY